MDNGSADEMLSFKSQITDRVNELTDLMEQAPLEPVCTADSTVWCIDSAKFVTMCQLVCHMFCSPDLPKCVVSKPTRHYIDDGGKPVNAVSVTVSLQDRYGNAVIGQCEHLEVTSPLVSHVTVKEQDEEGGVYKITYRPLSIEADEVMIKWNGRNIIQCSVPALLRDYTTLRVVKPVGKEGDVGEEDNNNENEPLEEGDIDEEDNDNDYEPLEEGDVDEEDNNNENEPLEEGEEDNDNENEPLEEGEEDNDNVNSTSTGVKQETEDKQTLTRYGPDEVELSRVFGLCNGPNDELIVADHDNEKLIVFDKDLQYSHTIGQAGGDEGEFDGPHGVACDKAGQLYVADYDNNRVQVFKLSGEFVTTFGTEGSKNGEFSKPLGLTLSSTGLLFVCDCGNRRVQVFDTQHNHRFQYSFAHGKFISDLTLNATEDKLFAVDGAGILVFTPQGQFLRSIAIQCGVLVASICSTPDGHLLVGAKLSPTFLSVYHEDGTLVCGTDHESDAVVKWFMEDKEPDYNYAVHLMNNGLIVVFCEDYYGHLGFDTRHGAVIL